MRMTARNDKSGAQIVALTGTGARFANLVSPSNLRIMLMIVIASMAIFMALRASS